MDYRRLGASGVSVSPLCLGTMMFGQRTEAAEANRIIGMARDAGVNFIDTADQYAKGESERIVGAAVAGSRGDWVIATKVGNPMGPGPNEGGLGRVWISRAIDFSLRRLGTDYIDLYYLHLDDPATPLAETVGVMGDLIRQGKIRYWGFSNFRAWKIAEMIRLCGELGVPNPVVAQPYYNAMNRMPEVEYLPACAHYGIGVVPYSPLARGVLTGKYRPDADPDPESRAGKGDQRMMETEFRAESIAMAETIKRHAEAKGGTAVGFAMRWVLANPLVTSVIGGPRTEAQWQAYLDGLNEPFDADDEALIDSLVPSGHPSTPGYNDPRYPITGRPIPSV
ncbi:MAG TPA: aldo/keto reductase [Stellaceae bacterium]|nr:aldo/keto reductase [Stellaceae bacterium]